MFDDSDLEVPRHATYISETCVDCARWPAGERVGGDWISVQRAGKKGKSHLREATGGKGKTMSMSV